MVKRRLFLLRHPPVAIAPGICYGASDVPLAEPAERHADYLRAQLPHGIPVFSSPLKRCLTVAALLGAPVCDPRLAEMDFGDWEMQPFDAIPRQHIDTWARKPFGFRPPRGETGQEVAARALVAMSDILDTCQEALIVSHGGPLRCIVGQLLGLPMNAWLEIDLPHGALCELAQTGGSWRLIRLLRPAPPRVEHSAIDS